VPDLKRHAGAELSARDKRQALREIITARNGNVRELLAMSGYAPR